jgi:hypothetical protein
VKREIKRTPKPGTPDTQITPHAPATNHAAGKTPSGNHVAPDLKRTGLARRWQDFWFTPADPAGLHVTRILCGLLFAFWLLTYAGHVADFFGLGGWFDVQAYRETARMPGGPPAPFNWSLLYLVGHDEALLGATYWISIAVVLLFAAGVATRITSVLTWVVVVSFIANPAITYDADYLLVILAFYPMLGYLLYRQWSRPLTTVGRVLGPTEGGVLALPWFRRGDSEADPAQPSYAANLAMRLLQVHFALIIFFAAVHKLQFGDWWAGVAAWYPMHPPLETSFQSIKTNYHQAQFYLFAMSLAQYLMLAWQLCFPLFAWRRGRWRVVLLGGSLLGWLGCLFVFRQPLFGPILVIASLSYLTPEEWRAAVNGFRFRLGSLVGGLRPAATGKSAKIGT